MSPVFSFITKVRMVFPWGHSVSLESLKIVVQNQTDSYLKLGPGRGSDMLSRDHVIGALGLYAKRTCCSREAGTLAITVSLYLPACPSVHPWKSPACPDRHCTAPPNTTARPPTDITATLLSACESKTASILVNKPSIHLYVYSAQSIEMCEEIK